MSRRKVNVSIDNLHPKLTKEYIDDRVDKSTGCWLWTKSTGSAGYGQVGVAPYNGHVVSYVLYTGNVGVGEVVRHTCHNRSCCNPEHLLKGTHKDNWNDSEDVHREASKKRRGLPAHNRKAVLFRGVEYQSKEHARLACKVSYNTVLKEGIEKRR